MPAKKKPTKKKKAKPAPKAKRVVRRVESMAVGDVVRMPTEIAAELEEYGLSRERFGRSVEAIEGIVCSIREIASGKLLAKTRGALEGFVLEILQDRTFLPQYSANRNSGGPKGSSVVRENPNWLRLRALLLEMAGRNQLISQASGGFGADPFETLLDGWRVVKLRANLVEVA